MNFHNFYYDKLNEEEEENVPLLYIYIIIKFSNFTIVNKIFNKNLLL